jgi:hypothetical protein
MKTRETYTIPERPADPPGQGDATCSCACVNHPSGGCGCPCRRHPSPGPGVALEALRYLALRATGHAPTDEIERARDVIAARLAELEREATRTYLDGLNAVSQARHERDKAKAARAAERAEQEARANRIAVRAWDMEQALTSIAARCADGAVTLAQIERMALAGLSPGEGTP